MATALSKDSLLPVDAAASGTPDQPEGRISTLDFVRGVAILGILATNILNYGQLPGTHRWLRLIGEPSLADKLLWVLNYLFIDGKLRGLFAILFGAGLVLFMDRAKKKDVHPYWLQFRRLFWLALFGLFHFYVLFAGDILFHYAALGVVAMLLVRLPVKPLLIAGLLLYCSDAVFSSIDLGGWALHEREVLAAPATDPGRVAYFEDQQNFIAETREEGEVLATGSLPEIVRWRLGNLTWEPFLELPFMVLDSFACMLIGAALFRMGFFSGGWNRRKLIRWGTLGIVVSVLLSLPLIVLVWQADFPRALNMFVFYGPVHVTRLPMIFGFAAVLVAMTPKWAPTALGQRLSAAGRMAFTNYVGASAVMALIFQGWGLALYGQFMRPGLELFVLLGWALMLVCSPWWLARFRFGPLEWIWRCLTYWRLFPIRKAAAA
ncbi:DUF418 domain-containing protein [Altererythrobacter salegens]|uniref:DUF418 domain-containing protein n=1 Tax=Croceibacterium salegens TaxID=1737568 RepID=A0A6I4SW99_9SPHN|nr:DUF418 domain-containing protein [Croceibacterium salegens]MXO59317.1 DUF418 domain-containing protein [Croceibacterium salegens]